MMELNPYFVLVAALLIIVATSVIITSTEAERTCRDVEAALNRSGEPRPFCFYSNISSVGGGGRQIRCI